MVQTHKIFKIGVTQLKKYGNITIEGFNSLEFTFLGGRIKKGFITEKTNLLKKVMFISVFAEEPQGTEPTNPQGTEPTEPTQANTVNFEDLIAKARQQEKAKLYPQIQKLQEQNNALTEKNNAHLLTIGEKDARISELEKQLAESNNANKKGASDKETSLLSKIAELEKELTDIKANTVSREEIEAEIKAEYEVKLYREQKLREVGDTVIPELITGTTIQEIDASIKVSQDRYNQITSKVLGGVQVPVANVSTSSFQSKDLKIEDIANLDPRSPEYAQLRARLGLR